MDCEVCLSEKKKTKGEFVLRTFGLAPDELRVRLQSISFRWNHHPGGVDLLFEREEDREEAKRRLGDAVYTDSWRTLEEVVGELLRENRLSLSTAESCTAGLVSARIVNVPGSSLYFAGGIIAYSNELKVKLLGVREETLRAFGAVSEQVCREMLRGLRERFGTDTGIAVTGVAGPGASESKPQGLTYIGVYVADTIRVEKRMFSAGRNVNRFLSSQTALNLLRKLLGEVAL